MKYKCENCGKEFFQEEMTTYEGKNVCKICKVKIIQDKSRADIAKRSGARKPWNILNEEQKEFVKDNYCKMSAKDMATELGVGKHLVGHFLRKNDIKKETAASTI